MRNTHLVVILFPLAACASLFALTDGDWLMGEMVVDEDGCGVYDYLDMEDTDSEEEDPETYTLTMHEDDGGFTLSTDGEVSANCFIDVGLGSGVYTLYTCDLPDHIAELVNTPVDYSANDLDAVVSMSAEISGLFDVLGDVGTYSYAFSYSCEGADCEAAQDLHGSDLPCSSEVSNLMTAVE